MHGCKCLAMLALAMVLTGCCGTAVELSERVPSEGAALGEAFDEALTGTLSGTVAWHGEKPQVALFKVFGLPGDYPFEVRQDQPNPNAPKIGPEGAIEGAIVFLRHVDRKKSKPWDHPDVRIEQCDHRLVVRQGDTASNIGFVRAGASMEAVNRDNHFHMLRGRGAEFFSLPLPRANQTTRRRLPGQGVVELSSGAFFFWMHGYLLVDAHPYYTRTEAQGRFVIEKVPAGSYELVCWMPNWEVGKRHRDPDTGHVIQVDFAAPLEQARHVEIKRGEVRQTDFAMSCGAGR